MLNDAVCLPLRGLCRLMGIFAITALCACGGSSSGDSIPQAEVGASGGEGRPLSVVAIGNSITFHRPSSLIGWGGSWGMAASHESKDYAAQLAALISLSSKRSINLSRFNISEFEMRSDGALPATAASSALSADLVVLALGDNVDQAMEGAFIERYAALIKQLQTPAAILVCVSTYWARPNLSSAIKSACQERRGIFVDIGDIHVLPGVDATALSAASDSVKKHPGDVGMQKIAQSIHSRLIESPDYVRVLSIN